MTATANRRRRRADAPENPGVPFPNDLSPMKATLTTMPSDQGAWGFEIKWDGVRALARGEPGGLRLVSRNGRDITGQYPEIQPLAERLASHRAVLDGELVAFDDDGRPSFQRLQPRMHVKSEAEIQRRRRENPVVYVVFDLLYLDGRLLLDEAYEQRRRTLEELDLGGAHWQVPEYHRGEGASLLDATRNKGMEGVIAKRLDSPYRPGRRSRDWLKIKNMLRQEVVIGGWLPGKGRREGRLGALLVGYYEDRTLRYAGKVGTGFDDDDLDMLGERLALIERTMSPFTGRQPQKGAVFVEPELVCEVTFTEWTQAATLRHPSYQGLRGDKPATDVVRETPA